MSYYLIEFLFYKVRNSIGNDTVVISTNSKDCSDNNLNGDVSLAIDKLSSTFTVENEVDGANVINTNECNLNCTGVISGT